MTDPLAGWNPLWVIQVFVWGNTLHLLTCWAKRQECNSTPTFLFFTTGSYLHSVGDAENLSKNTACCTMRKVVLALTDKLNMFVVFPSHLSTRTLKEEFFKLSGNVLLQLSSSSAACCFHVHFFPFPFYIRRNPQGDRHSGLYTHPDYKAPGSTWGWLHQPKILSQYKCAGETPPDISPLHLHFKDLLKENVTKKSESTLWSVF